MMNEYGSCGQVAKAAIGGTAAYLAEADTVVFYQDAKDEWRWKRTAANGSVVGASTEGYKNFSECKENLERQGLYYKFDVANHGTMV